MVRKVLAIPAGIAVLAVVVLLLQSLAASFHPLPEGLDPGSREDLQAFRDHMAEMPIVSWVLGFSSELIGGFLGALTAGFVARGHARIFSGVVIGLSFFGSVVNWTTFEHPFWFVVGQLIGYPFALMVAWTILDRRLSAPEG